MTEDGRWHLDKKVPIALIVAILIQTGTGVWWLSSINSRVVSLEARTAASSDQPGRIIRVETQIENMNTLMRRIEEKLDRVLERK